MFSWELRRWQGQYGKLIVLLLGFSFLTLLIAMMLNLGSILFDGKPNWINKELDYVTVVKRDDTGILSPVDKMTLLATNELPNTVTSGWLSVGEYRLADGAASPVMLDTIWFSDTIIPLLNLSKEMKQAMASLPGAWITDKYWKSTYNATSVVGKVLSNKRLPQGVVIRGVLPPSFDQIGHHAPDVWLSGSFLRYKTPFTNKTMIDKFLLAAPMYIGIVSVEKSFELSSAVTALRSKDLSIEGMSIGGGRGELTLYDQVNFTPKVKESLELQFNLIALLVVSLSLVLIVNTFTLYTSQMMTHQADFRLMQTLGASTSHLVLAPILGVLFNLIVLAVLSLLIMPVAFSWLINLQVPTTIRSVQVGAMGNAHLYAFLLVALVYVLASFLNFFQLNHNKLFDRAMGKTRGIYDKFFSHGMMTFQFLVALISLTGLITIFGHSVNRSPQLNVEAQTLISEVELNGSYVNLQSVLLANIQGVDEESVAISASSFHDQALVTVNNLPHKQELVLNASYVSHNYFDVLEVSHTVDKWDDWIQSVVISETALKFLSSVMKKNLDIGHHLYLGVENKRYQIIAIIEDLPHLGTFARPMPSVYLPINFQQKQDISLFGKKEDVASLNAAINWLKAQSVMIEVSNLTTMEEIVKRNDALIFYLIGFASFLVFIIILAVVLSLHYQLKARIQLERVELGVMLALGATSTALFYKLLFGLVISLLVAGGISIFAYGYSDVIVGKISLIFGGQLDVIPFETLFVAFVVLFVILVAVCALQLYKINQQPIQDILRQDS